MTFDKRLDDWLDGELPPADVRMLEAHAASCAACGALLASARHLQQQAFTLPAERQPVRDLWPGIAARLEARQLPSTRRPWWHAVAAAVAVVAVFAGGMLANQVMRESDETVQPRMAGRNLPSVDEARRLLPARQVALIEGGEAVNAGAEQDLLRNLLVVNLAIRELEAAVEEDPSNADLRTLLSGLYVQEQRILARAERMQTVRQAPPRTAI